MAKHLMNIRFKHCIFAIIGLVTVWYIVVRWAHAPNHGFLAFWVFSAYEIVGLSPRFLFSALVAFVVDRFTGERKIAGLTLAVVYIFCIYCSRSTP
jgi:hypothetical protein